MRYLGLGIKNADLAKIPRINTNDKGDQSMTNRLKGKILLQVEEKGEAWYVHPVSGYRYYLGRPNDAFNIMRYLGFGISNRDLNKILIDVVIR